MAGSARRARGGLASRCRLRQGLHLHHPRRSRVRRCSPVATVRARHPLRCRLPRSCGGRVADRLRGVGAARRRPRRRRRHSRLAQPRGRAHGADGDGATCSPCRSPGGGSARQQPAGAWSHGRIARRDVPAVPDAARERGTRAGRATEVHAAGAGARHGRAGRDVECGGRRKVRVRRERPRPLDTRAETGRIDLGRSLRAAGDRHDAARSARRRGRRPSFVRAGRRGLRGRSGAPVRVRAAQGPSGTGSGRRPRAGRPCCALDCPRRGRRLEGRLVAARGSDPRRARRADVSARRASMRRRAAPSETREPAPSFPARVRAPWPAEVSAEARGAVHRAAAHRPATGCAGQARYARARCVAPPGIVHLRRTRSSSGSRCATQVSSTSTTSAMPPRCTGSSASR